MSESLRVYSMPLFEGDDSDWEKEDTDFDKFEDEFDPEEDMGIDDLVETDRVTTLASLSFVDSVSLLRLAKEIEDINTDVSLTLELVPESCWYKNLRSELSEGEWKFVKDAVLREKNYRCSVCSRKGKPGFWLHCHETWTYDEAVRTQTLTDIVLLCPDCHNAKHPGRLDDSAFEEVLKYVGAINKWGADKTRNYVNKCFSLWETRSKLEWKQDMSFVSSYVPVRGIL